MTAPERRPTPPLPERIETVYLIGICGTAMGSLASMLQEKGYKVLGSDQNAYPPMSDYLAERGIDILPGWEGDNLHQLERKPDLVVVGNVCRENNPEVVAAQELDLPALSLPETLRELFLKNANQRVVVTGTHGKTTTSSLIAWILEVAGREPSFMIGGIVENFGSNYQLGRDDVWVVEGDEYDSAWFDKVPKFWHYEPTILTINNVEFDHADIYDSVEEIRDVFVKLTQMMPPHGKIWANLRDANVRKVLRKRPCTVHGFGVGKGVEMRARDLELVPGAGARFRVSRTQSIIGSIESPMPGIHNVYNVLAATGVALSLGIPFKTIAKAVRDFKSVRKRQELIGEVDGIKVYDDFAHHPTAVRETVTAIRTRHPTGRLWGVFEVKSNTSRRRIFQDDYPPALSGCSDVVLTAPWKKDNLPPEELIDLEKLVADLKHLGVNARKLEDVQSAIDYLVDVVESGDIVLGMSGSAFDNLHQRLLAALEEKRGEAPVEDDGESGSNSEADVLEADEGASEEGASEEGASEEGASEEGASDEGASDEGASDEAEEGVDGGSPADHGSTSREEVAERQKEKHTAEARSVDDEPDGDEPDGDEPDGDEPVDDEPDGDEPVPTTEPELPSHKGQPDDDPGDEPSGQSPSSVE